MTTTKPTPRPVAACVPGAGALRPLLPLLALLAWAGAAVGQSYPARYRQECTLALEFYNTRVEEFRRVAGVTGLPAPLVFAIVAPELTQYSHLKDKVETYALKVLYVQSGKAYADFSIGCFQMKPSFVERLEEHVAADSLLATRYADCLFPSPDTRAARVERVNRLNTVEWQMVYLEMFCEAVGRRFGHLTFATPGERLCFYASAYNCGFHKSERQIRDTALRPLFPHFSTDKYRYSDIALWFHDALSGQANAAPDAPEQPRDPIPAGAN
ncbi:MAG: hypothetical protein LBI96_05690 [Odoribacteraceae bacterium]|jgi:hypothetical protein|nr:hypothetical protein [Odoribacteraceae bacterium]